MAQAKTEFLQEVQAMKPNIKIGGNQPYNMNAVFPVVSGAAGAGYSAIATVAVTVYPEPATGNFLILKNTDDSNKYSLCFYNGTAWQRGAAAI